MEYKNLMSQLEKGRSLFDEMPNLELKLFQKKDMHFFLKKLEAIHGEHKTIDNLQFRDFVDLKDV